MQGRAESGMGLTVSDRDPGGNPGNCRDYGFCRDPGTGKISLCCRDSLPGFYTKFNTDFKLKVVIFFTQ